VARPDARGAVSHGHLGGQLDPARLVYGRNPVREALRGKRRVNRVFVAAGESAGAGLSQTIADMAAESSRPRPPVSSVDPDELTAMSGTCDHQGIVAEVDPYPYAEPEQILEGHSLIVALDEIQDPHNLGAIIRTAEGAGAGVVITRHRAAEVTGAVVKASAGATEHVDVARVRNLTDFLLMAKERGFWVYGTAADAPSGYADQDFTYPTCFVMGSEGGGLGRRVAAACDAMVSLPLAGLLDSLNVSVSTGILLYEAVRQRMVQGGTDR
jgi:23S rRNA (guanosine2251-2'-O)-methyltransferase